MARHGSARLSTAQHGSVLLGSPPQASPGGEPAPECPPSPAALRGAEPQRGLRGVGGGPCAPSPRGGGHPRAGAGLGAGPPNLPPALPASRSRLVKGWGPALPGSGKEKIKEGWEGEKKGEKKLRFNGWGPLGISTRCSAASLPNPGGRQVSVPPQPLPAALPRLSLPSHGPASVWPELESLLSAPACPSPVPNYVQNTS